MQQWVTLVQFMSSKVLTVSQELAVMVRMHFEHVFHVKCHYNVGGAC